MTFLRLFLGFAAALCVTAAPVEAKTRVVTTTTDLAEFVRAVGGDLVEVYAINRGDRDPHYVEVRPSYMLKVRDADLLFKIGLELDLWIDPIIDGSRNSRLRVIDCSKNVTPLEVPAFTVDARYGDLHRFGNPHYWLDPDNVPTIITTVADALSAFDPAHAQTYAANAGAYLDRLAAFRESWQPLLEQVHNLPVVFYHNSWPYFAQFSGISAMEFVEPKPGIPPSPGHIEDLINTIVARKVSVVAMEPYFDRKVPDLLAAKTGARVVMMCPSVGGVPGVDSYPAMITYNLRVLAGEER